MQRNATQRIPQLYLKNNFKFYIAQFFKAVNFLSAVFGFAKISSFIKESKIDCSFLVAKKNQKTTTFFVKKSGQKNNYNRITKSIRKNFFALCGKFINLFDASKFEIISRNENYAFDYNKYFCRNGNNRIGKSISHSPRLKSAFGEASYGNERKRSNLFCVDCFASIEARNDKFNYIHAFSCALKNQFEIISQLNYGFCYKNYFFNLNQVFRNSYDFGERFGRNLNYDFEKNCNGGFGKNYFGNCNFGFDFWNEICNLGNNLKGFLFNRKILKTKI